MNKPKPKDFGYDCKYGWPDKEKLQDYRKAMAEYQKYLYLKGNDRPTRPTGR